MSGNSITAPVVQRGTWLAWLLSPEKTITEEEKQQLSRLLSAILVTSSVAIVLIVAYVLYLDPRDINDVKVRAGLLALGLLVILFFVNRAGYLRLASATLVISLTFLFIIPSYMSVSAEFLAFTVVPMLLAGIFFSFRGTFIVTTSIILIVFVMNHLGVAYLGDRIWRFRTLWYFMCFAGPLVLSVISHISRREALPRQLLEQANQQLRESEILLEKRVQERTRDLELAANIARQSAAGLDLGVLLPELVERTRTAFDLYSVAVFLHQTGRLIYEAGAGPDKQILKARVQPLSLDSSSDLVARAARERKALLIDEVTQIGDFSTETVLAETRCELALPLIVGQTFIGVLDLRSRHPNAFSEDSVRVFTFLADQTAVAIYNASLYTQQIEVTDELRTLSKVKDQFLAGMSHELRTPLNAILNFADFLAMGMIGPVNEAQVEMLSKIGNSGRHLLDLINDVLDIAKIQSGQMKLFIEPDIDVSAELETVFATTESLLRDKPVSLIRDIDPALPRISADRRRLRQILLNLLSNAAKFTEKGTITFSVKNRGDEIQFTVLDTGPGIRLEDQARIFEPFVQSEAGLKHNTGTGLGLPISRRLAEQHGGKLWLESTPGEGSAFFVIIPVIAVEHAIEVAK